MAVSWLKRGGQRLFDRWRGIWRRPQPEAVPPPIKAALTPFRVLCRCGHPSEGLRQPRRQILTCPKCQRRVFILPASPWTHLPLEPQKQPAANDIAGPSPAATFRIVRNEPPSAPAGERKLWRQPVRAAVITLLLAVIAVIAILLLLETSTNRTRTHTIRDQVTKARQALERGDLTAAHASLSSANHELERLPKGFPQKEAAEILRLHRQVELVAGLSTPSLEELIAIAKQMPAEKWGAHFAQNYAGKAVVFDAVVFPEKDHRVRLDYELMVAGGEAGIELNNIEEFTAWVSPNQDAQRWVFGVRLANIDLKMTADNREALWLVHFQPESMELITEPALLQFLELMHQRDIQDVLARQRKLVSWEPEQTVGPKEIEPDTPAELVSKLLGPPRRIARQILVAKLLEQWCYDKPQPFRIRLERPRGGELRVAGQ